MSERDIHQWARDLAIRTGVVSVARSEAAHAFSRAVDDVRDKIVALQRELERHDLRGQLELSVSDEQATVHARSAKLFRLALSDSDHGARTAIHFRSDAREVVLVPIRASMLVSEVGLLVDRELEGWLASFAGDGAMDHARGWLEAFRS